MLRLLQETALFLMSAFCATHATQVDYPRVPQKQELAWIWRLIESISKLPRPAHGRCSAPGALFIQRADIRNPTMKVAAVRAMILQSLSNSSPLHVGNETVSNYEAKFGKAWLYRARGLHAGSF